MKKATAPNAASTQALQPPADYSREMIRLYVLKVRAVANLLEDITGNIYEYKNGLEEFAEQVEALSEALSERVKRLEIISEEELTRLVARVSKGGAQ
jgi:hypothetical protein